MKVKICGIRTVGEAKRVHELGTDAIGVLVGFDESVAPNVIPKEKARQIVKCIHNLRDPVETFLLTDKKDAETNYLYSSYIGNSHIQLLGDIKTEDIIRLKKELPEVGIVKVIHVSGYDAVKFAEEYGACRAVDALLLDSRIGYEKRGGTGITHDWTISRKIVKNSHKPVWLAGGLRTSNLRDAIVSVRPYGVDVETGVENPDGSKNYDEIGRFIYIAKHWR